jgi:beta-xylosidase
VPTPFSFPWEADAGDGTYRNPILHADYSDPDVIRLGDDFYLTASSFNCTPGLPILHSRDLVNWTIVNHAIKNVPHPRYREVQPGCGVWAPSIRFHAGKFWIFFPMPDEGIYLTTAKNPAGQWSEPHLVQEAKGWIDPCPFWDDDGQAYLVHAYSKSRAGIRDKLHVRLMAPDGSRILGEGRIVIDAPHHPCLEGPKVHKLNGWYYILAPGGGVPTGWQVALRSRNIYGPYEEKIVLEQGSTKINGPHQGALIDLPNGEWWFVHFQDAGPYGRITHLQPVKWRDDWPLMGVDYDGNGVGEPVATSCKPAVAAASPVAVPQTSDEFDGPKLGLQWQWHANHEDSWCSLAARPSYLRLFPQPAPAEGNLGKAPNLLMQKFPARLFTVETALDFPPGKAGETAGLVVVGGGAHASLALIHAPEGNQLVFQINGEPYFKTAAPAGEVRLRIAVDETAKCTFCFAPPNGQFTTLEKTFQAREGGWIGAKVGLFAMDAGSGGAQTGHADFSYFRFLQEKPAEA